MLRCRNCGNILEAEGKSGLCRRCERIFADRCPVCCGEKRITRGGVPKACPACRGTGQRK